MAALSNSRCKVQLMALKLSMTCGPYDRARALIDGKEFDADPRGPRFAEAF